VGGCPCISWGPDAPSEEAAAWGDKKAMLPFAELLWTHFILLGLDVLFFGDYCFMLAYR